MTTENTNHRPGRIVTTADAELKLPELGKIKTGMKLQKGSGANMKEYPTSLDHFIAKGKYEDVFNDVYPDKPKTISIIFPTDNIKDVCYERLECRDEKGRLLGYGDGHTFQIWDPKGGPLKKGGYVKHVADTDEVRDLVKHTGKWDHTLTLRFVIPKIKSVFGWWRYETKAKASSIPSIISTFDRVQQLAGTIVNVPFDLTVEKVKSQKPGDAVLFPVVNLVPNLSLDKIDEIRNYLQAGNNIMDIKQLIEGKQPDLKMLAEGTGTIKTAEIEQNTSTEQVKLFPETGKGNSGKKS